MAGHMNRKSNILLIGLPGCGKSTVGVLLAKQLGWAFVDMDDKIEKVSGQTIPQLFQQGEEHFRDIESEVCRLLSERKRTVIAAGGGVVKRTQNMELLAPVCHVVFLDRRAQDIVQDVNIQTRPLLAQGAGRVLELEKERRPLYLAAADQIISGGVSPMEATQTIMKEVIR